MKSKNSSENYANPKPFLFVSTFILGLCIGIFFTSLFLGSRNEGNSNPGNISYYDQSYIDLIYNKIVENHIGTLPTKEEITQNLANGLIQSLKDPYSFYLNPQQAEEYLSRRNPDFQGIGVILSFQDNYTYIQSVLKGYPAERAGLFQGDLILEVNGEKMDGVRPEIVATKIKGEAKTEVSIKIYRKSNNEEKIFKIIREKISISNINYDSQGEGIYKISISQFIDESVEQFNLEWDKTVNEIIKKEDLKGIVMDLRGNPGGYVAAVKHVIEEFLTDGKIMYIEKSTDESQVQYRDFRKGKFESVPLIVLVDQGSASASEIFSASIQDNNRGKIVGTTTVGKGVEQIVLSDIPDKSLLVLVFQKWLTPLGRNIDKENPIKPDIEVNNNENKDLQLENALVELKKELI